MHQLRKNLTGPSQTRLKILDELTEINILDRDVNKWETALLVNMVAAFSSAPVLLPVQPIPATKLIKLLSDFNITTNGTDTKFEKDIHMMRDTFSLDILVDHDMLRTNFLMHSFVAQKSLISVIMHTINTFCRLYPGDYDGLTINICLDDNNREIIYPAESAHNHSNIMDYLRRQSLAFNISGMTQRSKRLIYLTRKEEIIKVLFHELTHYAGLDATLVGPRQRLRCSGSDVIGSFQPLVFPIIQNTSTARILVMEKRSGHPPMGGEVGPRQRLRAAHPPMGGEVPPGLRESRFDSSNLFSEVGAPCGSFNLAIDHSQLNPSEAYTEWLAIILNSAYQAVHLYCNDHKQSIADYYNDIMKNEIKYSIYLSGVVLLFYGYDNDTYQDFFNGVGDRHHSPIPIWEYIILRTQLMLNFNQICGIIDGKWRIGPAKVHSVINCMKIDNEFVDMVGIFMRSPFAKKFHEILNGGGSINVSYIVVELDWRALG